MLCGKTVRDVVFYIQSCVRCRYNSRPIINTTQHNTTYVQCIQFIANIIQVYKIHKYINLQRSNDIKCITREYIKPILQDDFLNVAL